MISIRHVFLEGVGVGAEEQKKKNGEKNLDISIRGFVRGPFSAVTGRVSVGSVRSISIMAISSIIY